MLKFQSGFSGKSLDHSKRLLLRVLCRDADTPNGPIIQRTLSTTSAQNHHLLNSLEQVSGMGLTTGVFN
jgi:hypothetical protein